MAKFHEKAIAIYGVAQTAEGQSAILSAVKTGTISVTLAGTTVTGVGTAFDTELQKSELLYNATGAIIGRITAIASATSLTITPAEVAVSGGTFTNSANVSTGTITTTAISTAVTGVGTSFLTELAIGAYLYTVTGAEVGVIESVTDDTNAVLEANALVALSGTVFQTGLGAKNALAVLNLNFNTELTTEAFQYTGNELDRDEDTIITDKFAKFDFETFLPKLGIIAGGDPTIDEVPMLDWFGAGGMAAVLSTGSAGYVTFTNSQVSNEFLSVEIRRSSPDITTQKVYQLSDARGSIDLAGQIGTRSKPKFNYMGNLDQVVQKTALVPDFAQQKANIAPTLNSSNVTLSELVLYTSASEPALTQVTNFCFDKIDAPNMAGFEYDRFKTSCEDGWSKGAVPSDVTVTVIEDEAGAIYNPDNQLEKNHVLVVRFGSAVGDRVELYFHKLQLSNIVNSTVAKYTGQDLTYRNTGTTDIKLS